MLVNGFVGLSGPYDPTSVFGCPRRDTSEPGWRRIPAHGRRVAPTPTSMKIPACGCCSSTATDDDLVPIAIKRILLEAAEEAGLDVHLEELPGASHMDTRNPNLVTDLIVEFVKEP